MQLLNEHTDAFVTGQMSDPQEGIRERARQLLRVPAQARQAVEAELNFRHKERGTNYVDLDELRAQIVTEYLIGAPFRHSYAQEIDPR